MCTHGHTTHTKAGKQEGRLGCSSLADCLPRIHRALGSSLSATEMGHGNTHLQSWHSGVRSRKIRSSRSSSATQQVWGQCGPHGNDKLIYFPYIKYSYYVIQIFTLELVKSHTSVYRLQNTLSHLFQACQYMGPTPVSPLICTS